MIELDGNYGEGGGQIIRTALAFSTLTGKPFRAANIRSGRPKPGLKSQHLYAVKALKELCNAHVEGEELGSTMLEYIPRKFVGKSLTIDIGTAGSITLLLQALLPVCLFSNRKLVLRIKGGTDTKWSMPIDYFISVYMPHIQKYAAISVDLLKRGYYPKGGGKVKIRIAPRLTAEEVFDSPVNYDNLRVNLSEQPKLVHIAGVSHASKDLMQANVAERQARSAKIILSRYGGLQPRIRTEYSDTLSTGSGICLWAVFSDSDELDINNPVILGSDSLGEKGKRAELVGEEAAIKLKSEIDSGAAVDKFLADQILPFMGLFPKSGILASEISEHAKTNIYVIEKFLKVKFNIEKNSVFSK